MAAWFENDELWEDLFPFMFPPHRLDEADQETEKTLVLSGITKGSALDLCCGPGRHSIALAARGFDVTAVDRTAFLLDKARERAKQAGTDIEFVQCDMRAFVRQGSYDLAVNLFTSFGYFDDHEDNLEVLRNVCDSLKQGGALVMDLMGKEVLARIFQPVGCNKLDDGSLLVQQRKPTNDWNRMQNEWTLIRNGRVKTFEITHWIYSGQELKDMLRGAGFGEVRVFGNLDGDPYDQRAGRLVAVARKT